MASDGGDEGHRRPPPLGLRGLTRAAFLPRSGDGGGLPPLRTRHGGGLPPLGLAGRGPLPSFSIGTAASTPVSSPSVGGRRRVGLSRPPRPPSPNQPGSSNWATSPGGSGSASAVGRMSSYVGLNIMNGSICVGPNSSVFCTRDRSSEFAASTNSREGGWRGAGYNPNFENADEYPPRPEHVQAPSAKEIDLNALANKNKREQYTIQDKRNIYAMLLARNGEHGRLKKGVLDSVARDGNCSRRCVSRIWKETKLGGGVNSIKNNLKLKTGRKKMSLDIEALEAIPPGERTTIRQVAAGLHMSKSTVHRRLKEKVMRRVSNELKPSLTEANKKARVAYCLENLEPSSLEDNPTFKASFNKVHLDEKIFYRTRKTQKMYLSNREEAPKRECKHKNHIQQIMFLSAMARPRDDSQGNCVFDGKIGVWAFVDWVQAQKKSANRGRGEWELKPSTSVDRNKSREYIVQYVLPAIKEKWPESDRWNTVYIQQDNARTHVLANDPIFAMEAAKGGWDIRIVNQPPNSPDCNILDLGWFASIQSMFHRKMPNTLPEIVQKVNESLAQYSHRKLNRIWLSHQACMREIIKKKGSIHYDTPHMKKKTLERLGLLPVRLTVDKVYVDAAIEYLSV